MGLRVNPAPPGFRSSASKDIESGNNGAELATSQLINAVNKIHRDFKEKGYYDAIRESDLYTKGNSQDVKCGFCSIAEK